MRFARFIFLAAGVVTLNSFTAEPWFNDAWPLRRTLIVSDVVQGGRLRPIAYATVPTLGKCNSGATDFRVVNDAGKEVKSVVISSGFDDHAIVAFDAPKKGLYKLYFGNANAKAPPFPLEPDAGVVLEVRELGEGAPNSWDEVQAMIQKSPMVLGRALWPQLEVNFNPFGSWEKGIYVQTATVDFPVDGTYGFQSNAYAASFLRVDGKLVVDWPGWHNAKTRKPANQRQLELKAGPHRVEYVNVFNAHGACLAGWQKPGDRGFTPIPVAAMAGYSVAQIGPVEAKNGALVPDFNWQIADDFGLEGRMMTSVQFIALTKGKVVKWDFGDGSVSFQEAPIHVYIEPGSYTVKCSIDGQDAVQNVAARPLHGHKGKQYEKRIAEYAAIIHDYPTDGLSPAACFELALICHEATRLDDSKKAFRAAFEKGYVPKNAEEFQWLRELYEMYRDGGQFDDAIWVCEYILKMPHSDDVAAMALNMKAEIQYDFMNQVDAALETCKSVLLKFSTAPTDHVRMAYIRMGEYAMVRGDRPLAIKTLDEAQKADKWRKWTGDIDVTEGAHELNYTQYLRAGEYEGAMREIVSWEWKTPTVKLTGQTRFLRGRLYLSKRMFKQSLLEFDRALLADSKSAFADEIYFYRAIAYENLKELPKAKELFAKVIKDFPESNLAGKAKEKLERLK